MAPAPSLAPALIPLLVGLIFVTIPFTIARLWLKRIARQRRAYEEAERSVRLQTLAEESVAARARGERFVPPPGWER
jgi:hypothetical protein